MTSLKNATSNTSGVDGLIVVAAGAGGHAGITNPMSFVAEVRSFFSKRFYYQVVFRMDAM